ncbi:conjugal transfer protein [Serratia fonticola]|uniref:TIGR03751 family conjugal transfer lipoprotein n=1 Tax=Serratia fonticola TaxID=47917 RepID=UPI0008FD950D|nr:TIGR03751 family conjugal transfer lipoprotein [Serratia fonticola]OIX95212.1 conjugal transfer protein [Serratia fonticola]QCR63001.1 TIGR03751 family conjugal transfer lipoprotein [Serratia fonticola]
MKRLLLSLLLPVLLTGCSTSKEEMLPAGEQSMMDVWQQKSGGAGALTDARAQLRRPLETLPAGHQESYTRTAHTETVSQFPRLPNPDLVMYIFPHLSGNEPAPVPGYSTVFPLYSKVQYALPGERLEEL